MDISIINAVKSNCISFTIKLIKEIQKRVPSNYIALEKMQLLSVQNALRAVKDRSITDLAKSLGFLDEDIEKILKQWTNINFVQWKELHDSVKFWGEVSKYKDAAGVNTYLSGII